MLETPLHRLSRASALAGSLVRAAALATLLAAALGVATMPAGWAQGAGGGSEGGSGGGAGGDSGGGSGGGSGDGASGGDSTDSGGTTEQEATAPAAETDPSGTRPASLDDLFRNPAVRFSSETPGSTTKPLSYAPTGKAAPQQTEQGQLYLAARLVPGGPVVKDGIVWRIYSDEPGPDGRMQLVATATSGIADFDLDPGTYLVHAAYGHAGLTKRMTIARMRQAETLVLNAGGLKLNAVVAKTIPLTGDDLYFDIYETDFDERGERRLVARSVAPGTIARLNVGTYHIVSRYGNVNAVVRADIRVEPGKLTEATIYHNAARVTLKLVNEAGGEALANTDWSVLTPGGDAVVEGSGAFPSYVLAAGHYTVVARNMDKIYTHEFEVNAGRDGEVEVRTTEAN